MRSHTTKLSSMIVIALLLLAGLYSTLAIIGALQPAQAAQDIDCHVRRMSAPEQAYTSLQAAIDDATADDLIKIAGTCSELNTHGGTSQIAYIDKPLTLQGGYAPDNWTQPDPDANPTLLDAEGGGRVIYVSGEITVTIENLQITGGDAVGLGGDPPYNAGGGIYARDATLILGRNEIYLNYAQRGGGVFIIDGPSSTLTYNLLSSNTVTGYNSQGGGVYIRRSPQTILQANEIRDNEARVDRGGKKHHGGFQITESDDVQVIDNLVAGNHAANTCGGGSIQASDRALIENNDFEANSAGTTGYVDAQGGGLCVEFSDDMQLSGNSFVGNQSLTWGGGLFIGRSTSASLVANRMEANTAAKGGGLFVSTASTIAADGNLMRGNHAAGYPLSPYNYPGLGGGIYWEGASGEFANTVIIDNSATDHGSGVYLHEGAPQLIHATIARNEDGDGTGVYVAAGTHVDPPLLINSIVATQTAGVHAETGSSVKLVGLLWHGNDANQSGSGAITVENEVNGDPRFAVDGFHLADCDSAAIGGGIFTQVSTDIDGEPRVPRNAPDLGADERACDVSTVQFGLDVASFGDFPETPVTENRLLATGMVTVNLDASGLDIYDAASLRIFTDNPTAPDDGPRHGLVGQSIPTDTLQLKVWTPNFGLGIDGDGDGIPDIDNEKNWRHITETVWVAVADKNLPIREEGAPWDHALYDYTDLFKWNNAKPNFILPPNGKLTLHQPLHFALSLEGKSHPQAYATTVHVEFVLSADGGDNYTVYSQTLPLDLQVNDAEPLITLDVEPHAPVHFGALSDWPTRSLAADKVTVSFSGYGLSRYDAATLRVYTQNPVDNQGVTPKSMVGVSYPVTIPLKVWTPNFGLGHDNDGDGIPDIDNDENWRDNEKAVWVYVTDWTMPVREDWWHEIPCDDADSGPWCDPECAWCTPLFDYTDLFKWSDYNHRVDETYGEPVYHLPNVLELIDLRDRDGADRRVPLHFAADFSDALPQDYTTTLYIEAAFSADGGEAIAAREIVTVPIQARVPAAEKDPISWLVQRVRMRPDMDSATPKIEKLADSNQETQDWSDSGWVYDQALAVMALTASGHVTEARQVLNGLDYLQNDDGSWHFAYMTNVTAEMVAQWADVDETTLYSPTSGLCIAEPAAGANGIPDELEKRACWHATHNLPVDQIDAWLFDKCTPVVTHQGQTATCIPDRHKYRIIDYRKFMGTNAWAVMAVNFYEFYTGDESYREMALEAVEWMEQHRETEPSSPAFGGFSMGRVWWLSALEDFPTTHGFQDPPIYVAEHNFDAYSVYQGLSILYDDEQYAQTAEEIKAFLLRELWLPHVDLEQHPELPNIDHTAWPTLTVFLPALNMSDPITPDGFLDTCIYLDGQSWSVLALGAETEVNDLAGNAARLDIALPFLDMTMFVVNRTIYSGTGYEVSGIRGYKEKSSFLNRIDATAKPCEPYEDELVWSEGSEGVVSAHHWVGRTENGAWAETIHANTASYMLPNGGIPYSTEPVRQPPEPGWNWTDTPSIAGAAWYYFNEQRPPINPFRPWEFGPVDVWLPLIFK